MRMPGIKTKGERYHHQHHANHHPHEAAGALFEGGLILTLDETGGHRAELRLATSGQHEGLGRAALHITTHQASIRALLSRGFFGHRRHDDALDGHRLARQRRLGKEEVLGLNDAAVGRDNRARGEHHNITRDNLVDRYRNLNAATDDVARRFHHRLQLRDSRCRAALLEIG